MVSPAPNETEATMKDSTLAMKSEFVIRPPLGIEGLDELAAELGVKADGRDGIAVEGRSGQHYDLVALLRAHLLEMRAERRRR
jgi:hypothetical protein